MASKYDALFEKANRDPVLKAAINAAPSKRTPEQQKLVMDFHRKVMKFGQPIRAKF